ncbi:MAG: DUF2314 domain-containing protein [Hyphomonadaceae bacterium]
MRRLLLPFALLLAACSGGEADSPAAEEAKFQQNLTEATAKARAQLPYFWEHFLAPQVDEFDFSVKAALARRDGQPGAEEVWLDNIAKAPDKIIGELSIKPRYLGTLEKGAVVDIQENQITDWAFWRGDKLLGHYTTRILLPRLDQLQQDFMRPLFEASPDPAPK